MAKYIVTIAPPTPNGDMHLGHLSGPFLAADVFARIRRLKNDEVLFISYSDDYQDYAARKALENQEDRFRWASKYGQRIDNSLKKADIALDWFLKPYNNHHYKDAVQYVFQCAVDKGKIGVKKSWVPYSEEDGQYGYEAFAKGTCNYCGSESDASQCECCANYPIMEKMGPMISMISKKAMGFVEKERMYLEIDKYKDYLKEFHQHNPIRAHLRVFIDEVLSNENIEWFIDRPQGNGIDFLHNGKEITLHTWFSGLPGYLASSKEYWEKANQPEQHQAFWYDDKTRVVNFLGFDCSYSHAIVYPALASNIDGLTKNFTQITNKFLKLNGEDFSTSRSHAIWVDEILERYPSDNIRFYTALISPEEAVTNFELEQFVQWNENLFEPTIHLIEKHLNRVSPLNFSDYTFSQQESEKANEFFSQWDFFTELSSFSMKNIAGVLQELLSYVGELFASGADEKAIKFSLLYIVLGKPIHPSFSQRMLDKLSIDENQVINWLVSQK